MTTGDPCSGDACNTCQEDTDGCFDPAGTTCGDVTDDACNNPDTCDGAGACQENYEPVGTSCGDDSDTECDDPDTCDGAGRARTTSSRVETR